MPPPDRKYKPGGKVLYSQEGHATGPSRVLHSRPGPPMEAPPDEAVLLREIQALLANDQGPPMPKGDMDLRADTKAKAGVDMPAGDVDVDQAAKKAAVIKLLELLQGRRKGPGQPQQDPVRAGGDYGTTR